MKGMKQVIIGILPNVDTADRFSKSEWNELVGKYLDRLNPSRVQAGYKELTPSRVGKLLSQAGYGDTTSARDFFKACEKAKNFGAFFNHMTKKK